MDVESEHGITRKMSFVGSQMVMRQILSGSRICSVKIIPRRAMAKRQLGTYPTTPPPTPTTTITNTEPLTIFEFSCLPTAFPSATISSTPSTAITPTASPVPPIDAEGQELIDELRTLNLYVALIANGGFEDVLCSAINPPALSNNTGINGTAVQNEVCFTASIQAINPPLYPLVVQGNQIGLQKFAEISLYAVQVAAGYGGVTATKSDLEKLYEEIDEESLNALFIGYILEEGTRVKNYVRNAAKRKI
ncbi:MAG: hypothetical protein Q9214_005319 [Letrouitia sp. 1 TL-2023]